MTAWLLSYNISNDCMVTVSVIIQIDQRFSHKYGAAVKYHPSALTCNKTVGWYRSIISVHIYNKRDPTASPYLERLLGIIGYIVLMLGQN